MWRYSSGLSLPNLGRSSSGEHLGEPRYLVVPAGTDIVPIPVRQRSGRLLYAIDPREISGSLIFHPGGLYGAGALISGEVGASVDDVLSRQMQRIFQSEFFREFRRIWDYHVGPEAVRLLSAGARLTPGVKWSREADLKALSG